MQAIGATRNGMTRKGHGTSLFMRSGAGKFWRHQQENGSAFDGVETLPEPLNIKGNIYWISFRTFR
jgi:hypothetical protein